MDAEHEGGRLTAVHVHAPVPTQIIVQVIPRRCRTWRDLRSGRSPRTVAAAKRKAALALAEWTWVREVRVIACYEWYDPHVVFAARRS
jgi:hypothetical protein